MKTNRKFALEWYYTHQKKGGLGLISFEMSQANLICKIRKFIANPDSITGSSTLFLSNWIQKEYGFDVFTSPIPKWYKPDEWLPDTSRKNYNFE